MFLQSRVWCVAGYAGALAVWMAGIFLLSAMSGSNSGYPLPFDMYVERKGAHVFEYAILVWLWFRLFACAGWSLARGSWWAFWLTLVYAFSDEAHQLLVSGREGRLSDVLIDLVGIGGMALANILRFRNKNTSR